MLRVLLQSRSQTLQKQLQEMHEQTEQTVVELKTFENLRNHEVVAVPKRVEVRLSVSLPFLLLLFTCFTTTLIAWCVIIFLCRGLGGSQEVATLHRGAPGQMPW